MKIESFDKEKSVVITTMGQKLVRELQSTTQKETLEEAAENYGWRIKRNSFSDKVKANELAESAKQDFIAGANWQAERSFTLEQIDELFFGDEGGYFDDFLDYRLGLTGSQGKNKITFKEWFEQVKKK